MFLTPRTNRIQHPPPPPFITSSHSHPPMASSCCPEDEEDLKMKKPIYELTTLMQTVATSLAFKRHILDIKSETPEEAGVREGEVMMRRQVPFSQRDRKAGCRNFFWKTFTSC
uniref:Somatostatin/Cortistatin C-terminal domain-containing protein n=1 Tax=Takifugu rubripes TaxID=31033 RepID=A0A674PCY3_TAKRU